MKIAAADVLGHFPLERRVSAVDNMQEQNYRQTSVYWFHAPGLQLENEVS